MTKISAVVDACVLNNITSVTPALHWSELKKKWPHLSSIPMQSVAKQQQVDLLIGSDLSIFHYLLQEVCGNKPDDHGIAWLTNLEWVCFGPTLVEDFRCKTRCLFTLTYRTSHVNSQESVNSLLLKKPLGAPVNGHHDAHKPNIHFRWRKCFDRAKRIKQVKERR